MDLSVEKTYPSQPLIYNTNYRQYASGVKYLSPQDFIDQSVNCQQKACEKDFWTKKIPMKMTGPNITVAEPDISKQFKQFDSMAYKKLEEMGTPSYGNIFINEISGKTNYQYQNGYTKGDATYSLVLFLNSTSAHVTGAWAAYAQEIILRQFLGKQSGTKKVQLKIYEDPLPLNNQARVVIAGVAGFMMSFAITIAWLMISGSMIRSIVAEREKNLKNQMIVSGIKLPSYWMGHYCKDVFLQFFPSMFALILIAAYSMELPGVWVLIVLNMFANCPFLYVVSFLFDKSDSASTATSLLLFVFGFVGPIAVFILVLIEKTRDLGQQLKWILSIVPLFSVSSGIIWISMKNLIALVLATDYTKKIEEPTPFSEIAAGPQLTMLLISIPTYWFLVALLESGII